MPDVRVNPATWHEEDAEWIRTNPHAGTINTMLLINWPLTPGAMARAAVTMTEGKSAALRDLAISSRYSHDLATGTGTDQYCIASPLDETRVPKTNAGHHAKLGELIGRAVRKATLESLRWQNGLEPSHTRSIFHALKRFGIGRDRFLRAMDQRLKEAERVLLEKNLESVVYEPRVSAAAYAYAAVWDRVRYGTLSQALADPVLRAAGSHVGGLTGGENPKRGRPVTPGFTQRKTPRWISSTMRSPSDGV